MFYNLFGTEKENIAPRVIMSPILGINPWKGYFDSVTTEFYSKYYYSGITGKYNEKEITVVFTGTGIRKVGDALFYLKDAEKLMFLGSVGGISDVSLGDLVLGNKICGQDRYEICLDGEKIIGEYYNVDEHILNKVKNVLEKKKNKYFEGTIASLCGFAMENENVLDVLRKENVLGIDFESLTFMKLAQEFKLNPILLYFVGDLPGKIPFYERDSKIIDERKKAIDKVRKTSLEVMGSL